MREEEPSVALRGHLIGATGFEPATFRPPVDGLGVWMRPGASDASLPSWVVDSLDGLDASVGTTVVPRDRPAGSGAARPAPFEREYRCARASRTSDGSPPVTPRTRYAVNGGVNIAYQVGGEGPDLVIVPGFVSHLEMDWAGSDAAAFLERLSSFCRLIRLDKRGTGLSDPSAEIPTLETRMEDVHAVLDEVGSERATLLGYSEGGPMAALFAATYPERTQGLIMYGTFSNGSAMLSQDIDTGRRFEEIVLDHWGDGNILELFAPSAAGRKSLKEAFGVYERAAASPGMARAVIAALSETDVSSVLPSVRVPTLVLHREHEIFPIAEARRIAGLIPGARMVALEGQDHLPFFGDTETLLGEIEEFVTGARTAPEPDRALMTVMFTDIVDSTARASELGDAEWREHLSRHNDLTRGKVEVWGGRPVKSTGDGYLATFDGPAKAVGCARELTDEITSLGIELRAGVHIGECELLDDDIAGMAVHIGARIGALAGPGEVLVSSTVKDLMIGSTAGFTDRGGHELKGVPGQWQVYRVGDPDEVAEPIDNARLHRFGDRLKLGMARRAPRTSRRLLGLSRN